MKKSFGIIGLLLASLALTPGFALARDHDEGHHQQAEHREEHQGGGWDFSFGFSTAPGYYYTPGYGYYAPDYGYGYTEPGYAYGYAAPAPYVWDEPGYVYGGPVYHHHFRDHDHDQDHHRG